MSDDEIKRVMKRIDDRPHVRKIYKKIESDAKRLASSLRALDQYDGFAGCGYEHGGDGVEKICDEINCLKWFNNKTWYHLTFDLLNII